MLIDANHAEETRVVVMRGNRIEEFDFESASRKQLKGNIYLAKVTRVEPSLQAAFIDYGGNRHGFLAFAEIHPDYYQIPVADREALIREQQEEHRREAEDDAHASFESKGGPRAEVETAFAPTVSEQNGETGDMPADETDAADAPQNETGGDGNGNGNGIAAPEHGLPAVTGGGVETVEEDIEAQKVESVGAEDALEEVPQRPRRSPRRQYKIQEVIKRRQIILVQVVKEERGNKGAALTTYLSLAGRYCVLMPNTARGGGISRKITDAGDRRRLKEVARDIEVPEGMGLIVRTAGAQRTKTEIKRDYDYLLRLWENVRDLTLQSTAPALVYEEGSLIKRAIRDLYTKDVEEILVEGDDAYREAKDFMKMLMPSHARNVKPYKDTRPLLSRYQVDTQLDGLFSPTVTLPSGGYMVINQAEALVAIDINSGKSTREHNIEDTALKTNLEACDEIARQLRLRDLAGLIVIDFIDMDEKRNNRSVERRLKEALKHDRARIQVGRISHFGLLEMSRQRLRPSLLEGSTRTCPHCEGRGIIRSIASCALSVLRSIEEHLNARKPENLTVQCARDVAAYILNEKRDNLLEIESSHGISVYVVPSDTAKATQAVIERGGERAVSIRKPATTAVKPETAFVETEEERVELAEGPIEEGAEPERSSDDETPRDERRGRRRGRRGGRRGGRDRDRMDVSEADEAPGIGDQPDVDLAAVAPEADSDDAGEPEGGLNRREDRELSDRRGRGRRGRRGRGGRDRERGDSRRPHRDQGVEPFQELDRAPERESVTLESPPPAPEPEAEPPAREHEVRKWTPPAPTVAERPPQSRGGWWSKRT
jgi:ribonuclease E